MFEVLVDFVVDEPRTVLDLGCGSGNLSRPLAARVDRIDAIDVSTSMVDEGKRLPGGDGPRLSWMVGRAEEHPLRQPYALVTAGQSLGWMNWDVLLPRLHDLLTPRGRLAIVGVGAHPDPANRSWEEGLMDLIKRFSLVPDYDSGFDLVAELTRRRLFQEQGRITTAAVPLRQSAAGYIESFHARASLPRGRMGPQNAAAFDAALRQLLVGEVGETIELEIAAEVIWGKPLRPGSTTPDR